MQVEGGSVQQGLLRSQPHDLAADHAHAIARRLPLDHLEGAEERRLLVAGHVHGDLDDAPLPDLQAQGLDVAQPAAGMAYRPGDGFGDLQIGGAQVDVVGDEGPAGSDHRGPGPAQAAGAEVRRPVGVRFDLGLEALVLATADVGQIAAVLTRGGLLVEVDGDAQLPTDPLPHPTGHGHALLHGHAAEGDEGHHVGRADAGMLALVLRHINELRRLRHASEGGFFHRCGRPHEGDHRAVVIGVYLYVQHPHPAHGRDGLDHLVNDLPTLPLAEIGYTLNELSHPFLPPCPRYLCSSAVVSRRLSWYTWTTNDSIIPGFAADDKKRFVDSRAPELVADDDCGMLG